MIKCFVLDNIAGDLPTNKLSFETLSIPTNIKLADEEFYKPRELDILIGAELFWDLLCIGQLKDPYGAIFQKTKLGWIISGSIQLMKIKNNETCLFSRELHDTMKKFWTLEEVKPIEPRFMNEEEKVCENLYQTTTRRHNDGKFIENLYQTTTRRHNDGKFIVRLPLKDNLINLGDSYEEARRRFLSLEQSEEARRRFLSLEQRFKPDVTQMYRQVWIDEEQRKYQKILWQENPSDELKSYTLNTVTFGMAAAPFLAIRSLVEIAKRRIEKLHTKYDVLSRGCYPSQLRESEFWWNGPSFLKKNLDFQNIQNLNIDAPEKRKETTLLVLQRSEFPFENFSNLNNLIRTFAWCLRYKHNAKENEQKRRGGLSLRELNAAFTRIIKLSQMQAFPHDYKALAIHKEVNHKSNILSLNPFIDEIITR
ncbi:putative peptidase (DUF1758) [Popillia japonica]|uniref:Peptidase (DUF1758) n=1 Tax=Popillia japonica TaxID=7064 RepID=A0AAW1I9A9_POPJA